MGIFNLIGSFIININIFVVLVIGIIVWVFSNFYIGLLTVFFSLMVIITTPALRVKFLSNDWNLKIPVFPGTLFFRWGLFFTLVAAVLFGPAKEVTDSYLVNIGISSSRVAEGNMIYNISQGRVFDIKTRKWQNLKISIKAKYLGQKGKDSDGGVILKFQPLKKNGSSNGSAIWVPILQTSKASSLFSGLSKTEGGGDVSGGASKHRIVVLSSNEIKEGDFHERDPSRVLIQIPGLRGGGTIEFLKDFEIKSKKGRVYFAASGVKLPWVNIIPKGSRVAFVDSILAITGQGTLVLGKEAEKLKVEILN